MKPTGMMAMLGRFISNLGEKGLPFFKFLKTSDNFKWTDEADQALEDEDHVWFEDRWMVASSCDE
jgi:hypothetical protein